MIPDMRQYQLDLCARIRAAIARGKRIIVVQAATGAGKTSIACHIAKCAVEKEKNVFFMAHRRRLVEQASQRAVEFEINHGVIMAKEQPFGSARLQIASRDTILSRVLQHEWCGLPPADIVIVDEAHHVADPDCSYRKILERYPKAIVLLLTATPVTPQGNGLGPFAEHIECAAPTSELIRQKFLVPVKCFAPDREIKRGKVQKRGLYGNLVDSNNDLSEGKPTVLFCSRVQHSLDAKNAFLKAGIPVEHVDADTPDDERDRIFNDLESGKIRVVSNVGIIKEGVDIPSLGCCQIYMEMSGRVAFLQAVGRIMRPFPGKEYGILIDHSGAIFKHGFPDEDTEWPLEGSADEKFADKKKKGDTAKVCYCDSCQLLYKDALACPQCGKPPARPPKSIFAAPDVENGGGVLVEADRASPKDVYSRDEKVNHWFRCLAVAAKSPKGTFAMASRIFHNKYGEFPGRDFPCTVPFSQNKMLVRDKFPNFGSKKQTS